MASRTTRTQRPAQPAAQQLSPSMLVTVGLDVGDRQSLLCVLDERGTIVEEGRVPTTPTALERRFRAMPPFGNARRLRLIADSDTKTDRLDAEFLARVGRVDPVLLAPIRHREAATQHGLALLRARDALVHARTQLVNHVRGAVKSVGGRLPKCSTHSFARQVSGAIPEELRAALTPVLALIERVSADLSAYDRQVEQLAATQYPETARLRQVAGVGPLSALCFVLTLEDPGRFPRSRAVRSYLGLRPRQRDSGAAAPALRITKAGDPMLRRLLVTSAHYILGPFAPASDLRRWGLALAARGGKMGKRRAVVAVARKLAVLLHRLWTSGSAYVPLRTAA